MNTNATLAAITNPLILKSDSARVQNCIYGTMRDPVNYTQSIIDTLGALVSPQDVQGMKQKGRVHTVRVARWIASQGLDLGKFDRASAFCAAVICSTSATRVAYADLHHVCGGKGEGTAPIAGVSRAKLRAVISGYSSNMGTISTQVSRTVGEGGMFAGMGIVTKPDARGFAVTPKGREHPFILAYAMTLNGLSERTLIELMEGEDK